MLPNALFILNLIKNNIKTNILDTQYRVKFSYSFNMSHFAL